jgi:hypothetical protein
MANSYSTQDIVKGALQRVGERTDGSSNFHSLALKYVNRVYSDVLKGNSIFGPEVREAWRWARRLVPYTLPGYYNTGSVSLINNSVNGTFSTAPSISLEGYIFRVVGLPTFYSIATHTAGQTAFTLDLAYLEPTASALAYYAMPLILDLGIGVLHLVDPIRQYVTRILEYGESASDMGRIYYSDPNEFFTKWPLQYIQNDNPTKFTVISSSDTSYKLQFNKFATSPIRLDIDLIQSQPNLTDASTSIPLVPYEDRDILETGAAYYLSLDKRQFTESENWKQVTGGKLQAMKMHEQAMQKNTSRIFGQLTPRMDDASIPYWLLNQR